MCRHTCFFLRACVCVCVNVRAVAPPYASSRFAFSLITFCTPWLLRLCVCVCVCVSSWYAHTCLITWMRLVYTRVCWKLARARANREFWKWFYGRLGESARWYINFRRARFHRIMRQTIICRNRSTGDIRIPDSPCLRRKESFLASQFSTTLKFALIIHCILVYLGNYRLWMKALLLALLRVERRIVRNWHSSIQPSIDE